MPRTLPTTLEAEVLACREIHELPGDWEPTALRRLLGELEFDPEGATGDDLLDLTLMALGDMESREAGAVVLGAVFGERLGTGARAGLAADLEGDRPWDESADLSRQRGIFTAVVLLQKAFPRFFGKPDATRAEVAFRAPTPEDAALLVEASAAVVLRALAPGLGPRSIAVRLYGEGLRGGEFPEATHILWRYSLKSDAQDPRRVILDVCGAPSFLGALEVAAPWRVDIELDQDHPELDMDPPK